MFTRRNPLDSGSSET